MVNINEFCNRLVGDFSNFFRRRGALNLLTQNAISCKSILKICLDVEPDYVLEIGTNYGLSTLSIAYALHLLGKDLSCFTTTDIDHSHWINETPKIQTGLILNSELDVKRIKTVQEDFIKLSPQGLIKPGKVLVFYDIHDTASISYMEKFIQEWIPLFDQGCIMVHDCYPPFGAYWIPRDDPVYPVSSATHFSGLEFEGYRECKIIIDYLNSMKRSVYAVPDTSIIKFDIK